MLISDIWLPLVIFSFIAWFTMKSMLRKRTKQPSLPPGPRGLPLVGSLPFLRPQLHEYLTSLAHTHGPIMRLRLGMKSIVVVSSPFIAKQVLKDLDINFANRDITVAAREFSHRGNDLIFSPYGPKWRLLRKVSANGLLGHAAVDAVHNTRRELLHQTIHNLHEHEGCSVDIGEQMFLMVYNVMMSMLWGNAAAELEKVTEGSDFRRLVNTIIELFGVANVSDFFPKLAMFDLQGVERKMKECVMRLSDLVEAAIQECRKVDDKSFLKILLQLKDEDAKHNQLTMPEINAVLTGMIVAGTDTTSKTIEFAMAEIVNNPEVMLKARQELEAVVGAENTVEESHIHQLTYLKAIMKESLRLHPTLPLMLAHTPNESCIVGGYTIPKGMSIFINVWGIQRDSSVWEDCDEFKPERFLENRYDFSGNDFRYFPFGSGRRICAGVVLAERLVLMSLATLLHNFDWKMSCGIENVEILEKFGVTLKKATPLLLIPSSRMRG